MEEDLNYLSKTKLEFLGLIWTSLSQNLLLFNWLYTPSDITVKREKKKEQQSYHSFAPIITAGIRKMTYIETQTKRMVARGKRGEEGNG